MTPPPVWSGAVRRVNQLVEGLADVSGAVVGLGVGPLPDDPLELGPEPTMLTAGAPLNDAGGMAHHGRALSPSTVSVPPRAFCDGLANTGPLSPYPADDAGPGVSEGMAMPPPPPPEDEPPPFIRPTMN